MSQSPSYSQLEQENAALKVTVAYYKQLAKELGREVERQDRVIEELSARIDHADEPVMLLRI